MINVLFFAYTQDQEWPAWAWVEEALDDQDLDGLAIYRSMPTDAAHGYSFIWPARLQPGPTLQTRIGLSVAGLRHVPAASGLVDAFVGFVSVLGTLRRGMTVDRSGNVQPSATRSEVLAIAIEAPHFESRILEMLRHEPATWTCSLENQSSGDWTIELKPWIRRFAGVSSADAFLELQHNLSEATERSAIPPMTSPFTLPAAIDFLDVVWEKRFGKQLVVPAGVERSARLAFEAKSPEEADSHLSAFAELLKNLDVPGVPGVGGHPLGRLPKVLLEVLPEEAHQRVEHAIEVLNAARRIRAGAQHSAARGAAIDALAAVGLSYPVRDWSAAWGAIQQAAASAFDAIREELQAAPLDAGKDATN